MLSAFPLPIPFEQYLATGELSAAPTILQALLVWTIALANILVFAQLFELLPSSLRVRLPRAAIPGMRWLCQLAPSVIYGRLAPHRTWWYGRASTKIAQLDDLARHWDLLGLIVLDAIVEEFLVRGLPPLVAPLVGVSPVVAVVGGTLYWAIGHGVEGFFEHLPSGLLYAWLWITGAWLLAIALHATLNLSVHLLGRYRRWRFERRKESTADLG